MTLNLVIVRLSREKSPTALLFFPMGCVSRRFRKFTPLHDPLDADEAGELHRVATADDAVEHELRREAVEEGILLQRVNA